MSLNETDLVISAARDQIPLGTHVLWWTDSINDRPEVHGWRVWSSHQTATELQIPSDAPAEFAEAVDQLASALDRATAPGPGLDRNNLVAWFIPLLATADAPVAVVTNALTPGRNSTA